MSSASVSSLHDEPDAFRTILLRVRGEFLEMPGLTLTVVQAARLWSMDLDLCTAVLNALEQSRFLVRTRQSTFARAA